MYPNMNVSDVWGLLINWRKKFQPIEFAGVRREAKTAKQVITCCKLKVQILLEDREAHVFLTSPLTWQNGESRLEMGNKKKTFLLPFEN